MDLQKLAEVVAYTMPIALLGVGAAADKLIEKKPWAPHHFFLGLDLTIYFVTVCLGNLIDLAKDNSLIDPKQYIWTGVLIALAIVVLFVQTAVHQEWEDEGRGKRGQFWWLCVASNLVGLILLYGFVRMKLSGQL